MELNPIPFRGQTLPEPLPLRSPLLESRLLTLLMNKGLTHAEALGLIDCWRPQFLQTNGCRFLTIFGAATYDYLCPLTIHPVPTETARVGILLTEFPPPNPQP
jgi:hypothetical protein